MYYVKICPLYYTGFQYNSQQAVSNPVKHLTRSMNRLIKTAIDELVTEVEYAELSSSPRQLRSDTPSLLIEMALQLHPSFQLVFEYWDLEGWPDQREAFEELQYNPPNKVEKKQWQNLHTLALCTFFNYSDGENAIDTYQPIVRRDTSAGGWALVSIISTLQEAPERAIQEYLAAGRHPDNSLPNDIAPGIAPGLSALFYTLAVIKFHPPSEACNTLEELLSGYRRSFPDDRFIEVLQSLFVYTSIRNDHTSITTASWLSQRSGLKCPWLVLIRCICLQWLQTTPSLYLQNTLRKFSEKARESGNFWYHIQANELLLSYPQGRGVSYYDAPSAWLVNYIEPQVDWRTQLQHIEAISERYTSPASAQTTGTERLAWWCFQDKQTISIQPRIQKLSKNGTWTKGRKISLYQWLEDFPLHAFLSDQDKTLCHALRRHSQTYFHSSFGKDSINLHTVEQITALAQVQTLIRADTYQEVAIGPMQIELKQPCLEIIHHENRSDITVHITPSLEPSLHQNIETAHWTTEWVTSERLVVTCFDNGQREISEVLGSDGILIPAESIDRVLDTLQIMAPMITVLSNVEGSDQTKLREVTPNAIPHMELSPWQQGLTAQLKIYPLGIEGPSVLPDEGYATMLSNIDGETHKTVRNFVLRNRTHATSHQQRPATGV